MNTGVLGGGALGLTAAYRLAQAGDNVTLIEREGEVGGLAAGFLVGDSGAYLEKFYHHIFKTDTTIWNLIKELGLEGKLEWMTAPSSTLNNGKHYSLAPSPFVIMNYKPLPFVDRLRMGLGGLRIKLSGNSKELERKTATAWLKQLMGERAYKVVWEPQLRGKFGQYAEQITATWIWARVHDRTAQLGYLHGGFQQVYNKLAEGITGKGGQIMLGQTVTSLANTPDGKVEIKLEDGREFTFDRVICTFPNRVFARVAQGLSAEKVEEYSWGTALGAHCLILRLNRQVMTQGTYWLSITDPGYPFLVAVEHTNLIPKEEYGGDHLLYLGNYLPMEHETFKKSGEEILADYTPYLKRLNPGFDPAWVKEIYNWKAAYAQPVVTIGYEDHIPPHDTPLKNVWLANMFQVYPHDRGQNYSILMADQLVGSLTGTQPGATSDKVAVAAS